MCYVLRVTSSLYILYTLLLLTYCDVVLLLLKCAAIAESILHLLTLFLLVIISSCHHIIFCPVLDRL